MHHACVLQQVYIKNILIIHLHSMFPCQFELLMLSMLNPQLPYQIAKVAKQIVAHLPESCLQLLIVVVLLPLLGQII